MISKFDSEVNQSECDCDVPQISTLRGPSLNVLIMRPPRKLPFHAFNFNDCTLPQRKDNKVNCHTFAVNKDNLNLVSAGFHPPRSKIEQMLTIK